MKQPRRAPLWRAVLSWRSYSMPHPARTWAVLYLGLVLGLSVVLAVFGIDTIWAFVAGGGIALALMLALEARYRRRHRVP